MKKTIILSLFAALYSCSGYYHIKQARKHELKAIAKGVEVHKDTTFITRSDTLTEIDTIDNYIRITKYVSDTVFTDCKTVYIAKSKTEVRQTEKTKRTEIKQENKTTRTAARQDAKKFTKVRKLENRRSFWFNWFVIGLFCGAVAYHFLVRFIKKINHED